MNVSDLQEEALVLTGQADPQASGWQIVHGRPGAATHTCFVKLGPSGAILCSKASGIAHWQPALQVHPTPDQSIIGARAGICAFRRLCSSPMAM